MVMFAVVDKGLTLCWPSSATTVSKVNIFVKQYDSGGTVDGEEAKYFSIFCKICHLKVAR